MSTPAAKVIQIGTQTLLIRIELWNQTTGALATVSGTPSWSSSNTNAATVSASASGTWATVSAVAAGTSRIKVTASDGTNSYVGIQDVTTVAPSQGIMMLKLLSDGGESSAGENSQG